MKRVFTLATQVLLVLAMIYGVVLMVVASQAKQNSLPEGHERIVIHDVAIVGNDEDGFVFEGSDVTAFFMEWKTREGKIERALAITTENGEYYDPFDKQWKTIPEIDNKYYDWDTRAWINYKLPPE